MTRSTTTFANAIIARGAVVVVCAFTNLGSLVVEATALHSSFAVTRVLTVVVVVVVASVQASVLGLIVTADIFSNPSRGLKKTSVASFVKCFALHFSDSLKGALNKAFSRFSSF